MAGPADHRRHAETSLEDGSLGLGERRLTAIGPGEYFGTVIGGEYDDGVVINAHVLQLLHTRPTSSSSWAMPASSSDQPFSELRIASYFGDRCVTMCMRVGLSQTKNGLPSFWALSMKLIARSRISSSTVSIRFG